MRFSYYCLLTIFIGLIPEILAHEKAEAFIVNVLEEKIKVLSPTEWNPQLHVIVKNGMMGKLLGKVETEKRRVIAYVSLESKQQKSVSLGLPRATTLFFIPLAPPFQRVELKLGNKSYEIPPQEKN